jgi:hypothetical protein
MSRPDLSAARQSISSTLGEIVQGERIMREAGMDVRDPDEWQQLKDIVARIERRLAANVKDPAA